MEQKIRNIISRYTLEVKRLHNRCVNEKSDFIKDILLSRAATLEDVIKELERALE